MDPVRLKLDAIDSELACPHPMEVCSRRLPLFLPAISFMLGILIESCLLWPSVAWCLLLVGSPLILGLRRSNRFMVMACLALFALGGLRLACFTHLPHTDISQGITDQDLPATVTGHLSTPPRWVEADWEYASQQPMSPGQSFDLKVEGEYSGTIRVYVAEPVPDLAIGTRIRLHGRLSRLTPAPNPGQFDLAKHLALSHCFVTAFVKSPLGIEILPDSLNLWYRIARQRSRMQQHIADSLVQPGQDTSARSALLAALILGVRTDVPNATRQAFQTTGLLHLISLSGLHVGIFMSMVWAVGQCAGLLKPARSLLCLCVLAGFLWLVPLRAATVRAGLIAGLFCVAIFFRRKPQPLNTLSLAALILLLIRPTQLFEAGWQLSFSSVLGILLISPSADQWLRQRLLQRWPIPRPLLWRMGHRFLHSVLTLLAVGLGAWLGSAAILAYHFYSVTPLSVLYTVMALPLVALILMIGFVHILAVLICPWINPITLTILNGLSRGLLSTVHGLSIIPGSRILLGHLSWIPVTLYYGLLLAGLFWKRKSVSHVLIGLALTLPLVWIQGVTIWRDRHHCLELTCLSVGHGQALILRTPKKHTLVLDAGSLYQKDIGRRIVSAYLDYCGISHIHAIVASHNDSDHINGIPEIIQHCRVDHVYAPALMIDQAQRGEDPAAWLQQVLQRYARTLETCPTLLTPDKSPDESPGLPSLSIQQLWPDPNGIAPHLSDNNASLVLLITYGNAQVLITSDIEQPTQQRVIALHPNLHPDVLMAPHHGSLTTLSDGFLGQLAPRTILCSCGLSQFKRGRVIHTPTTYHTAAQGAITLLINAQGDGVALRVKHD